MKENKKTTGLFILLIAILFLLEALGALSANIVDVVWPILLGIVGLQMMS